MNRPTDFTAEIRTGGKTYIVVDNYSCEVFSARLKKSKERITLEIEPFNEMMFDSICIRTTLVTDYEDKLFFNGYQSWTDSREYDTDDKMRGLNGIPRSQIRKYNFDKYGDYNEPAVCDALPEELQKAAAKLRQVRVMRFQRPNTMEGARP